MGHNNTVFLQWMKLVSRHEFENAAKRHHQGRKLRKMTRWSQWIAMSMAQISGRQSLRDIESNLNSQRSYLYHLGCEEISRSSLSRVNEIQPYTLYEELFNKLYRRCYELVAETEARPRGRAKRNSSASMSKDQSKTHDHTVVLPPRLRAGFRSSQVIQDMISNA